MSNILIPFVDISTNVPLIKLKVGEYETTAIVDTGAESTLLGSDLLDNCQYERIDDVETNLVGIAGNLHSDTSHIGVTAKFGDEDIDIDGCVSDIGFIGDHFKKWYEYDVPVSFVLGSDFLSAYSAKIDFENKTIQIIK